MDVTSLHTFTGDEKPEGFLVTGIGASAGGIRALKEFIDHIPNNSGIAYLIMLHHIYETEHLLNDQLQEIINIPVIQVNQHTKIEPDHIYLLPFDKHLIFQEDHVIPSSELQMEDQRAPIDILFRNLAEIYGPRAVCVVLSGSGSNGSMGLKRIKERGGVTYVQNPREAEYNEMPRSSIATEFVDEVLPVAEIPARIMEYQKNIGTVQIPLEPEHRAEIQQQALREIFTQLRIRTGNDFSNYKRATILRRIERRINVRSLPNLPSYTAFLHEHPEEVDALLKDLLISVTNFFRDRKAFETLERDVIPLLFSKKKNNVEVRIWIAGCATGEEAYSMAMLCAEKTVNLSAAPKVLIFATDIDEAAILTAREGLYTQSDLADVSSDRLSRFFNREGDGYRVRREIREMVIFAIHNFLTDPPFSNLDLISCRNVMIYLNNTAQERVAETFHFSLKPKGFLFLGGSETLDSTSDLFSTVNRENRIYQAKEIRVRSYPIPESFPTFRFANNDPLQKSEEKEKLQQKISFGELHQKLLEQYAPPSIIVNEEFDIVHLSENAGQYLELTGGELSKNLFRLIKPELRLELRSALYQATQRRTSVEARNHKVVIGGQVQNIDVQVRPVFSNSIGAKGFILIIFKPHEESNPEAEPLIATIDEPVTKRLEHELVILKAQLRNSIEQYESQTEELKASNEELQAMNEELRSATEELETSKEELQSINEELRTVNQELKVKIDETTTTNNNLQNLINSTNIGTIFLDKRYTIRLFTPSVLKIFNLKSTDYGRPITDITNKLIDADLLADAEKVIKMLTSVEKEVMTNDNQIYLMRLMPYRTDEDQINGVVITFINITNRKEWEESMRQSSEYMRLVMESAKDYAIITLNPERKIEWMSSGAVNIIGYSQEEIKGQSADIFFTPEDRQLNLPEEESIKADKEGRAEYQRWHVRKDGSMFWGSGSMSPLKDKDQNLLGFVKIFRDLTVHKRMEETIRESEDNYRNQLEKEVRERTSELFDINNSLRYANENLQQFASIASHDLQEPLRKIKMFSLILNKKYSQHLPDEAKDIVQRMTSTSERMAQLIREVLEYSKIANGSKDHTTTDLDQLLHNVINDLDLIIEETSSVINIPEKLPVIQGIPLQLGQLFYNLLTNAIKFRKPESQPNITISWKKLNSEEINSVEELNTREEYYQISFSDNGIGFDPQYATQIFQIFERLHSLEEFEGNGVGLALCKKIVENHNGHIFAISSKGVGTTFNILLPFHMKN